MEHTEKRVLEIQKNGYDIDFGRVFENAFDNYKKIALTVGIVVLLLTIILGALTFGTLGVLWGFGSFNEIMLYFNTATFTIIDFLIYVIAISIVAGLLSPITAGILKIAHCASKGEHFSIGTVLDYYGSTRFKDLFLASFCLSIWNTGLVTVLNYFGVPFIGNIINFSIVFFSFLTIPFIIFGNLNALDAIKASFIVVFKQFFILLGLLIVSVLLVSVGIIGFCFGIFFTIPFIYSMYYSIYADNIGIEDEILN